MIDAAVARPSVDATRCACIAKQCHATILSVFELYLDSFWAYFVRLESFSNESLKFGDS